MMFKINDIVVYGQQGVCRIAGIDEKKLDGQTKRYFVLIPVSAKGTTFYVPTWKEQAWSKMRSVMTKQEINELIDGLVGKPSAWIENENERKDTYRRILAAGDQRAVVGMLRSLFARKKEREAEGKRLHLADEYFMKEAEQLLYSEWQYVLELDRMGLMAYILDRVEKP